MVRLASRLGSNGRGVGSLPMSNVPVGDGESCVW